MNCQIDEDKMGKKHFYSNVNIGDTDGGKVPLYITVGMATVVKCLPLYMSFPVLVQ